MKSKRILAGVTAAALLFGTGCTKEEQTTEQAPAGTAVEVLAVTSGPMNAEYTVTGKVVAVSEVQVFPLLAGQVLTLPVQAGDKVTKGQTLFTVDTSTVTSTLGALQESYSATKAATDSAIASAEIGVQQAQQALDNAKALFEVGAAAEQDVTRAEQAVTQAEAGVAQAKAQQSASLSQIQASMDQINTQASLGTVKAPCAGTVTMVNVVRGGMASSAQPAVVIAEDSRVEVAASVAEDVFVNIAAGEQAGIVISALSADTLQGTIGTLPAAANGQTGLYDLSVSLPASATPPIGAFATVTFYTDRRSAALSVPTEAVLTGENDERYVFVVQSGETGENAARVTVQTGLVSKTSTEIVSGLAEGDRVVVKGQSYLSDGAPVRVVDGSGAAASEGAQDAQDAVETGEEG